MTDYTLEDTLYIMFTTRAFATGIPTVLSGVPVVSAYENDGTTEITAGITLGVSHDSRVGMNLLTIVATAANGYEAGKDYNLAITTGTVGGVSVVGEVVGTFSIARSAAITSLNSGVNVTQISGDSTAADNLELMYDTTGYLDPTAPASRSQVDNIGAATGSSFPKEATEDNASTPIKGISSVGTQTGTFANLEAVDGNYHVITGVGNDIDWVYGFDIGVANIGVVVECEAFLNSNNDDMLLQAFDFVGTDWETIAALPGQNGSTNRLLNPPSPGLLSKHSGTGSDLGKVYLRWEADGAMTSPVLNIDLLRVGAVQNTTALGFLNAAAWIDTVDGTSGTAEGIGQATRPSDNIADSLTIAVANNLHRFEVGAGSSITLVAAINSFSMTGVGWTLILAGKDVGSSRVFGAAVSGTAIGSGRVVLDRCLFIGAASFTNFALLSCNLTTQTVTIGATGTHRLVNCEGSGATIDFGAAIGATTLDVFRWSGDLTIDNMKTGDVLNFHCNEGALTLNASCTAGTVNKSGTFGLTDSSSGLTINDVGQAALLAVSTEARLAELDAANIPADIDAIPTTAMRGTDSALTDKAGFAVSATGLDLVLKNSTFALAIADATWDEVLTGATHNVTNSSGKRLRQLAGSVIRQETAQGPGTGNNQIQLDTGASAVDDTYDPSLIVIESGPGVGQSRNVIEYDGTTKTATVDRDWRVAIEATSGFIILADAGRDNVNEGLVAAATSTTVTLNANAIATNNMYNGQGVFIRSGTGQDQIRTVISYVGSTRIATLDRAWDTTPDTTSGYVMKPQSFVNLTAGTISSLLTTQMTESYAANGVAPTLAQATFAMHQMLMQFGIVSTAYTVRKLDNTTTAFVVTLDDATNPTDAKRV